MSTIIGLSSLDCYGIPLADIPHNRCRCPSCAEIRVRIGVVRPFVPTAPPHSGGAVGTGLVPFNTSRMVIVDSVISRFKRLRARVRVSARELEQAIEADRMRFKPLMVTLTYRQGEEWEPWHITKCVDAMKKWAGRLGFRLRYVWCAEMQKERLEKGGRPFECVHYHIVVWVPRRFMLPHPDRRGGWRHGSTRIDPVDRSPVGYIVKYASKADISTLFPHGIRLYGCGGLTPDSRRCIAWLFLPGWVREVCTFADRPKRAVGGGFVTIGGSWFPSPWVVIGITGSWVCLKRVSVEPVAADSVE